MLKWATLDLSRKQLLLLHLECLNLQKGLGERMFSGSYRSRLKTQSVMTVMTQLSQSFQSLTHYLSYLQAGIATHQSHLPSGTVS